MRVETSGLIANLLDYHIFDFGYVYFFENVMVSEFNEGAVIEYHHLEEVLSFIFQYYKKNQNIVYISNRVNSYSINPTDLLRFTDKFPNVKAVAVIIYNDTAKKMFRIEKMFLKRVVKNFSSLQEAYQWSLNFLNTQ
ncbi:hypothetical protein [Abyssalbus ytuae]|uniref:STAS/SEC14 domain-containing protein n=1 Tax=Abyssalbus ytuae TaxID=2926907 RepID=A0A9E6ZN23_9FLAO|nr:hypothetical protein [Abyssalbus ytuae]UOB17310.1 hypothetical protein MQE35_16435 [Abyssalbus ytuae]